MEHRRGHFVPMAALSRPGGSVAHETPQDAARRAQLGFSSNYRGSICAENQSGNIPPEQSTSLFFRNLPPHCTYRQFLGAIAAVGPVGRIYSTHINQANPDGGLFTCAAKVVMFTRQGAEKLYEIARHGRLVIGGRTILVVWNRILCRPHPSEHRSRVLILSGPTRVVNEPNIRALFSANFIFDTERVIAVVGRDGYTVLVWHFGSWRCQAEAALAFVNTELRSPHGDISATYGADPCAEDLDDTQGEEMGLDMVPYWVSPRT